MKKNWLFQKNVVLTGVSSGIGRQLAKLLIEKEDCHIIGIGRRENAIKELICELGEKAKNFEYRLFDVSNEENWKKFAEELIQKEQKVDVLINNAGQLPKFKKFKEDCADEINSIMQVNFFSSVYAITQLLPILRQSETPSIVNVSSSASLCPLAGTSAYTASKSALKTFTECLIEDYRKKIYIAYVCPGFTKTEIFRNQNVEVEKIVDWFSSSCKKNTSRIYKKMKKRRKRIIVGTDAKFMDFFYRHFPRTFSHTCSWVLKKSKIKLYADVFKEDK